MVLADIPAVMDVERAVFSAGWPPTAFEHELRHNAAARYIVVENSAAAGDVVLSGFAGLWLLLDEAHVVTVAVRPEERGKGLGKLLVEAMLRLALDEGMESATLECRVSNTPARALYRLFGFHDVGLRKRYYENDEDAVIMTTEPLRSPAFQQRLDRLCGIGPRLLSDPPDSGPAPAPS
jgi:ribosomal-protein-alanine N-acetyltransferase